MLVESIEEYFDNYETSIENYALTEQHKFRYMHNLFDEDAKPFYRTTVVKVHVCETSGTEEEQSC